ncbi:hypothetical protein VTO42DRAFT_4557 [Malbranchea cinnamomea]
MKPFLVIWLLIAAVWANRHQLVENGEIVLLSNGSDENVHICANVCWKTLSCSLLEIEAMDIKNRLEFLKYIEAWKLGPLHSSDEFRAVEGVMSFFIRRNLARPGTWMSMVNAAVIEAIERGAAISLGVSRNTGGNPGTSKWVNFFDQRAKGRLQDRGEHDIAWATAEQTAVDYGIRLADTSPDVPKPPSREVRWNQFTRIYRTIMRYRRTILWIFKTAFSFTNPGMPMAVEAWVDWFTDVTDSTSTGFLADIAWALSALGLSKDGEDPIADSEAILHIATEFWVAFQNRDRIEEAY